MGRKLAFIGNASAATALIIIAICGYFTADYISTTLSMETKEGSLEYVVSDSGINYIILEAVVTGNKAHHYNLTVHINGEPFHNYTIGDYGAEGVIDSGDLIVIDFPHVETRHTVQIWNYGFQVCHTKHKAII